jgi:hypothetical protein
LVDNKQNYCSLCGSPLRQIGEIEIHLKNVFTPHLKMHGEQVGVLGVSTNFKDILNRPLVIGDVVEIFNQLNVSFGDNVVCDDGTKHIMGIKSSCDNKTGTTGYWKMFKKRGFIDVQHGERVDGVTYIKEQ